MNQTETYGFPYPECDPPLIKDSSQISQFEAQAQAVDIEVDRVINLANDNIIHPPSARVKLNVEPIVTTDNLVFAPFDLTVFEINWGVVSALIPGDGIRFNKPGWYLAGGHAVVSSATATVLPMVRLTVNGAPASSWSTPAGNYGVGNGRIASLSAAPLLVQEGDLMRLEIKHNATGSPSWDYRPHMWAVRMVEPA